MYLVLNKAFFVFIAHHIKQLHCIQNTQGHSQAVETQTSGVFCFGFFVLPGPPQGPHGAKKA